MGNMKANRKFKRDEKAVSAVIGVILMVAITVAIAATVFVYVNQMVKQDSTAKTMAAIYDSQRTTGGIDITFKVTSADPGIAWSGVSATWKNGTCLKGKINTTDYTTPMDGNVAVGDYFTIELTHIGTYNIDILYEGNIIWSCPTVSLPS